MQRHVQRAYPKTSILSNLLLLLAIISAFLLFCIIFINVIFPLRAEGTLTYKRISGSPVDRITVHIPISNGENIFKVSEMTAEGPGGIWTATPGPSGEDKYPDYWILTGPPLKPGESLHIRFIAEHIRDIDYEAYPWTVVADIETEAPVTVHKEYIVTIVTILEVYRIFLSLILTALIIGLTAKALAIRKSEPPVAFYEPKEDGLIYQEKPEEHDRCKEWHYVGIKFFIVDRCGERKENSGLLQGVKYPDGRGFGELTSDSINKILKLIEDANRIWVKCCIKLIPCLDKNGKPIFKALNPDKFSPSIVEKHVFQVNHFMLRAEANYRIKLCSLLEGRRLKGCCGYKKSDVNVKITWSKRSIPIEDPAYKPGVEVGVQQYREWIEKIIEFYDKEWSNERRTKFEEKAKDVGINPEDMFKMIDEVKESYRNVEKEIMKKRTIEGGLTVKIPVPLFQFFKKTVDGIYGKHCIDVFVFEDYEDTWKKVKEAGFAEMPGREIFLDESVVENCEGHVLAHEVGHNLSLPHHKDESNVMHVPSRRDSTLNTDQCKKSTSHLAEKELSNREVKRYLDYLRKKAEEIRKKPKPPKKPTPTITKEKPITEKPTRPGKDEKMLEEKRKLEKQIKDLEDKIRVKENLIRKNYIPCIKKILREEFFIEEENLEGDDIECWKWPENWKEDERLLRLRKNYYRLKNETEILRKKIKDLRLKLKKLKEK